MRRAWVLVLPVAPATFVGWASDESAGAWRLAFVPSRSTRIGPGQGRTLTLATRGCT